MDYFRRLVRVNVPKIFQRRRDEAAAEVSRMDAYFNAVYKILGWEDPVLSWATLGVFHVLFWIIVYFQLRLFGFIFLAILIAFLTDLYFDHVGLQAQRNSSSDAVREVIVVCNGIFLYLKALRKDNPPAFCITMCTLFLGLSMLSRNIPGYFLAYLVILMVFFVPLAISMLPPECKETITETLRSFSTNEGVLAESELIPFLIGKELNEADPELESLLTDKTADSVTNSLISGISSMPSYLDAEGSLDGLDEDELVPQIKSSRTSYTPGDNSSDSDSDYKNMKFESGHFNGDSSSEDENKFTKNLQFSEVNDLTDSPSHPNLQAAMAQSLGIGIMNNLAAMGTSLMSNVLKGPPASTSASKRKDSDSDFEIINTDEL